MSDYIVFAGADSRTYNAVVFENDTYSAGPIEVSTVSVPGRSGDLLISNKRYPNIIRSYDCVFYQYAASNYASFRAFLLSQVGYKKLVDSKYSDVYFQGYVASNLNPELTLDAGKIKFTLSFSCKPQRFLNSGDTATTFADDGTITNLTLYESAPLLKVTGTGTLEINDYSIVIANTHPSTGYMYIDCESGRCYCNGLSLDDQVTFSSYDLPTLKPGVNTIDLTDITSVEITPRWWTL